MTINSRSKGKRGELEASKVCREHWHSPGCIRAAQRDGRHGADLLDALPLGHVEVKRRVKIGALRFMDQAKRDMAPGTYPVVMMREDRGEWVVMFRVKDTERFVESIEGNLAIEIQSQ